MAERAGRGERPGEVRLFAVLQLEAEAPVVGVEAAEIGDDSREARELNAHGLGERLRSDQGRGEELAHERDEILQRSVQARGRGAAQLGLHAERLEDGLREILGKRHLRVQRDPLGGDLEAGVRVDPARARLRDRRARVERKPGRVGEQVADGRAGRAVRLVEVDRPLLGRDEGRERRDRLRERGPAKHARRVASAPQIAAGRERGDGDVLRRPRVRELKRFQGHSILRA